MNAEKGREISIVSFPFLIYRGSKGLSDRCRHAQAEKSVKPARLCLAVAGGSAD